MGGLVPVNQLRVRQRLGGNHPQQRGMGTLTSAYGEI